MQQLKSRREFLQRCGWMTAGAAFGSLASMSFHAFTADAAPRSGSAEKRLAELNIKLPPAPKPVAIYVPAVRVGNTLFTSGHGPKRANGKMIQGKVGADLSLEQGKEAARVVGLNVLSTIRSTLGSLDKVVRLVKVLGMVNCTPDFTKQPQVINGFSELMVDIFGEKLGKGARSAVGMGSLPSNIPVEIEAIFQVRG